MGMHTETPAAPRSSLVDIVRALETVVEGKEGETKSFNDNVFPDSTTDAMNVDPAYNEEYSSMQSTPDHISERPEPMNADLINHMLPPLLKSRGGLGNVPQETLRKNLQPIVKALERLDAELLLGLQQSPQGPRVRENRFCKPIYDEVTPPISGDDPAKGTSCVRYLHIAEVPDQYSIGVFVFAPFSRIPLHDHPDMCVLSRVLYGDLQRVSLDLEREGDNSLYNKTDMFGDKNRRSWLGGFFHSLDSHHKSLPKGSKRAFRNKVDYLQAPDVTVLYPYEGNLHEFVAGPDGAAVLDVLLPPYNNAQNRDCTFYQIQKITSTSPKPADRGEPCIIVPTGQPETFHCISGQYRDIGESEEYMND